MTWEVLEFSSPSYYHLILNNVYSESILFEFPKYQQNYFLLLFVAIILDSPAITLLIYSLRILNTPYSACSKMKRNFIHMIVSSSSSLAPLPHAKIEQPLDIFFLLGFSMFFVEFSNEMKRTMNMMRLLTMMMMMLATLGTGFLQCTSILIKITTTETTTSMGMGRCAAGPGAKWTVANCRLQSSIDMDLQQA